MAIRPFNSVLQQVRRAALLPEIAALSDGQLLASFIAQKDEAAFEVLVRRHGPMVLGVCRRILGNHHDAEEAFQASFLILARKASSLRQPELVAHWLHGVAYHTARKAKAMNAKRQVRERQGVAMPEPAAADQDFWHDLQPLLDQELNGLPEKYRVPIVLCDLEGKSIKEATVQLGWPQGTLAGRLARARRLLAQRLARRGVTLSGGALVLLLAQNVVSAGVPMALLRNTVRAACLTATGQTLVATLVPASVLALTKGVTMSMVLAKWKKVLFAGVMALCLCGVGMGGAVLGLSRADQADMAQGDDDKQTESNRMAALILLLDDPKFAKREAARKELEALGESALGPLHKAVEVSASLELRKRAEKVIAVLEQRRDRTDIQSVPPPKGAIVLFDGKNLDACVGREAKTGPTWRLLSSGVMEAQGADIQTWQTFADGYKLHVEFRVPNVPNAKGQGRGNSGIYLQGRYEIQILDSHGHSPDLYSCGAIYGLVAARVNACKAPEIWQSYDIEFHPPQFQGDTRTKAARVTVLHNGIRIHDNVEIPADFTGGLSLPGDARQPGPVLLQYHSSPVQFRNLWLLPLPKG